jgi:hypothetical protein
MTINDPSNLAPARAFGSQNFGMPLVVGARLFFVENQVDLLDQLWRYHARLPPLRRKSRMSASQH